MKLNKIFAALMLVMAVAFAACADKNPPAGPGNGGNNNGGNNEGTTGTEDTQAPDTAGWNIPAGALTVAEARAICEGLADNATTGTKYYVKGWIKKLANKHAEGISNYGNALFYMVDTKDAEEDFYAYQVYGLNGQKITNAEGVAVGDYVVIYGELTKYVSDYGTTLETVGKGAAHIWKSTNKALGEAGSGNTGSGDNNGGNTDNGGTSTDSDITVPANALVFDADADQGNAVTDYNQAGAYEVTKDGLTIAVTKGCLGTFNNEMHYRIYKNETLTITSTKGNIKEVVFTCTGNTGDQKWSPDCFTVDGGEYVYSGANGQWKGDASTVTFTASVAQVRATQIAVVVE